MVTPPGEYLAKYYEIDLDVYAASCICGFSTYTFATDGRADGMHDWQSFALVHYELNFIDQAAYCYRLLYRPRAGVDGWPNFATTRCPSQNAVKHPVGVLPCFERLMDEANHQRAAKFRRNEIVEYDTFFSSMLKVRLHSVDLEKFVQGVYQDPDCDANRSASPAAYLRRHGLNRIWETVSRSMFSS